MDKRTIDEGKTIAIISYITLIGLIIAYFMNNSKNNEFAKFHIGQSLRVWILSIVLNLTLNNLVSMSGMEILKILEWLPLILAIIGFINAVNGKAIKLPLIGSIGG